MTIPGDNPLAYQGVKAPNPPNLVRAQRAPTAQDINHDPGTFWLNELTDTMYVLVDISAGVATWDAFGGGTAGVDTLSGDSGGALSPTGGNISLAGGTNITSAGAGSTLTFNLDPAISLVTSVTSPLFDAPAATDMDIQAAAGQDIDIQMGDAAGANNVSFFSSTPGLLTSLDSLGTFTSLGDMISSRSDAGVSVTHQITNSDNTSLTSNAQLEVASGGAASGDAGVLFQVSGVATNWFAGLDNSDADAWVLSASATAGTNNAIRVDHASQDIQFLGNVDLPAGNLNVNGTITADAFVENASAITFSQSPLLQSNLNTGAAPTGATGDVNLMSLQTGEIMEQFILGAGQTIIAPRMTATGLLTSLDLVAAEGAEYNWGMRANAANTFTIGTSPAFFMEIEVNAADIGGLDPFLAGFRIVQANDATLANYTDFAAIGANATTAVDVAIIQTQLNTGGVVITNTSDAWTDGQTRTFRINVSAAGVVTYLIDGLPPTITAAFTFDPADVVAPFIRHLFGAATPGAINWIRIFVGTQ